MWFSGPGGSGMMVGPDDLSDISNCYDSIIL